MHSGCTYMYDNFFFLCMVPQSESEDRQSDPSLEEKLQQTAKELNETKRKSARRKEYVHEGYNVF